MSASTVKASRREVRKAFGSHNADLLQALSLTQDAHEHNLGLLRVAVSEWIAERDRLAGSFWARLKWIAVGR